MKRYIKGLVFYLLLFGVIIAIFSLTSTPAKQDKAIYSDFGA